MILFPGNRLCLYWLGWELEYFSCGNTEQYQGFCKKEKGGMAGVCNLQICHKGPCLGLHQFVSFIAFSTHCSLIIIINSYQTKCISFCLFSPPGRDCVLFVTGSVSAAEGMTVQRLPASCSLQRSVLSPMLAVEMGFARIRAFLFSPFSVSD